MRERGRVLLCALFASALFGCGMGAPPPTPVSFLRQVDATGAQALTSESGGTTEEVARLVAAAAGTYGVTRSFHDNICGFGSHSGEGTLTPVSGNREFGFRMHTDAAELADVEYSVTLRDGGVFTAVADAAPRFRAYISGRVGNATIEFLEEIEILDETSVCRGQTVQALVTATKR